MINIFNASLEQILPESLAIDNQFVAIAKALDPLIQKFSRDTKLAMHLPRLDELSGSILDALADQFHVDFYNAATLSDIQKRNLIRQSIALHKLKGTVHAVEFVAQQFFQSPVVEELAGFLFRLKSTGYTSTPDAFETFCRMLWDAKPVRSWLAGIDLDLSPPKQKLYVGNPLLVDANVRIGLRTPKGSITRPKVAGVHVVDGNLSLGLRLPKSSKVVLRVGGSLRVFGSITLGGHYEY